MIYTFTYLAGYTKLDKYQTLGFNVRYFSLGSIFLQIIRVGQPEKVVRGSLRLSSLCP